MSNKHVNLVNNTLGLSVMICDRYPRYAINVYTYNASVLGTLYLVGHEFEGAPSNIKFLDPQIAFDFYRGEIGDIPGDEITPSRISDLLSYMPHKFMEYIGHPTNTPIITFDSDFVMFNKALITRFTNLYKKSFVAIESNIYPTPNEDFLNCCFTFMIEDDIELRDHMVECIKQTPGKYTASGPSMLNKYPFTASRLREAYPSRYKIKTLRNPVERVQLNEYMLGLHLEASVYRQTYLSGELEDFIFEINRGEFNITGTWIIGGDNEY